jgi:hypothetical protein
MSPKDEDFIRFYRDAVIAGHDGPAAETMRHFNLSRDYIVRLLNQLEVRRTVIPQIGLTDREIARWKANPNGVSWLHEILIAQTMHANAFG